MRLIETLSVIVLLVVLSSMLSGCFESSEDTGDDFVFTTLDGHQAHLSDHRGKVIILDMMATWCKPCIYQMMELKKAYENYSRNDLEIISVDIDLRETPQQLQSFREAFKQQVGIELDWTFGMDDGSVWGKYGKEGIPTICMFDQKGNLHFWHEGLIIFSEIPSGWPEDTPKLAPKIDELLE